MQMPSLRGGPVFWEEVTPIRRWRYCKYCYEERPHYLSVEGEIGDGETVHCSRVVCYHCDSGTSLVDEKVAARFRRMQRAYSESL